MNFLAFNGSAVMSQLSSVAVVCFVQCEKVNRFSFMCASLLTDKEPICYFLLSLFTTNQQMSLEA